MVTFMDAAVPAVVFDDSGLLGNCADQVPSGAVKVVHPVGVPPVSLVAGASVFGALLGAGVVAAADGARVAVDALDARLALALAAAIPEALGLGDDVFLLF